MYSYEASEIHVFLHYALKNAFFSLSSFTGSSITEVLPQAVGSWSCMCAASLLQGARAQGACPRVREPVPRRLYLSLATPAVPLDVTVVS